MLAAVGALMLLGSLVLGLSLARGLTQALPSPRDILPVVGETVVTVTEGETLLLYAPIGSMPSCDITGPTEQAPNIELGGAHNSVSFQDLGFESVAKIGGPGEPEGEYTVECDEPGLVLAPPLDPGSMVGSVGALIGVVAVAGSGFVLMLVGLVLWLMDRRRT